MNIFYEGFPQTVTVKEKEYSIITDFREWIRFIDMFKTDELTNQEKAYNALNWFADDIPDLGLHETAMEALTNFLTLQKLKQPGVNSSGSGSVKPLFSYELDAGFIYSGFLQCYGIDIMDIKYMHWWKFKMLFDGIDEKTEIKQRIMYRSINLNDIQDKKERQRIGKIQKQIALPSGILTDGEIANAFM